MTTPPAFFDPDRIGTLFYPDVEAISAAASQSNLTPAARDSRNVHLLIIDMQVDFCHREGALFVPGAADDIRRLASFIFRHAGHISNITCTLDSHLPFQIFHAAWWVDAQGKHPAPLTIIGADDVDAGRWRPLVMPDFSSEYVHKLEEHSQKQLTIWPYHVVIGGLGSALDPSLWSAVQWHALARKTQPAWLLKGLVPQSEHYSAIQPEVPVPSHPQGGVHRSFLEDIDDADMLIVAGEAQSHCVLETLEDIVTHYRGQQDQLEKIYVLEDCMSPVQHPDIDFGAIAQGFFRKWAALGVNFVTSTDELPFDTKIRLRGQQAIQDDDVVVGLRRMAGWRKAR